MEGEVRPATVRHEEGRIVEIGDGSADWDFGDLVIMPGLVDCHVHVNEPGRTEWEGFVTATAAAAAGGTTTVVDMPLNSIPPTTTRAALETKRRAAEGCISVDVAFWGGVVPGSESQVSTLVDSGVCGLKAFMVDSGVPEFPPLDSSALRGAVRAVGAAGVPLLVHAEEPELLRPFSGDPTRYASYLATRPVEAESRAIDRVGALAEESGGQVHVLHVSSAEGAEAVGRYPALSGETCPHYLTFVAQEIPHGATLFKCAPPIREAEHREALWEALRSGDLGMVVSDHSPAPGALKDVEGGDFSLAWGGISSLQIRLPAVWTGATPRGFGLRDLAEWLSAAPARLAGLDDRKGSIREGSDADFVIWDPEAALTVRGGELFHRHPLTPYEGMTLRGVVVATVLRGEIIYRNGQVTTGRGRMLARR